MNATFYKNILNKGKVMLDSFQNFTRVNSYLHLKSFAWKRDTQHLPNYERHKVDQNFYGYTLLTDQISFSGCLYFVRY